MKEATQEEVEEAVPETDSNVYGVSGQLEESYEDPDIGEDGTFDLENDEGIVTDGGYDVNIVEKGDSYAILESEGETYLIEEASVEEDGTHVFEVIDNDTVCRPGSGFKSP